MQVGDGFHLTYCSNIHPGETWNAVEEALRASLPRIRGLLDFHGAMAIGLRLSAGAAAALDNRAALEEFSAFLRAGDYYVLTINGFPYGAFHGERVKERVYLPDWRTHERLEYSNRLARLLAAMLEGNRDVEGSVSTVPGAFRSTVADDADAVLSIARNFLRHAAFLVRLREETGVTVTLAIEPEPACLIETTNGAIDFFFRFLFDSSLIASVARETGTRMGVDDVRRLVGVCLDACHLAVEFEDPVEALQKLAAAGIRIGKVQITSALHFEHQNAGALSASLTRFADDTYLHQVVERSDGALVQFTDLPLALAAAAREPDVRRDWRVHFHVPIFMTAMQEFETTQKDLSALLAALKRNPVCRNLEIETYTWEVLPPGLPHDGCLHRNRAGIVMGAHTARRVVPRRPAWRADSLLSRISNLPTVWSNVLAGIVAAHAIVRWPYALRLAAGVSLLYTAGMFLNDAFDRDVDAAERPDRPIPAGDVGARSVFVVGFGLLVAGEVVIAMQPRFEAPVAWGAALAAAIVFYDARHKKQWFGPVVMGICRGLVYCVAAAATAMTVAPPVLFAAIGLAAYVVGLTQVAKMLGPRAGIVIPMLIAGISLFDSGVIAVFGGGMPLVALAAAGFPLTLMLQRLVPGT